MADPRSPLPGDRLETWGEIAAYLGREIRTVQRWEKTSGLPVHRLTVGPDKLARVYALKSELDAWWHEHEVLRNGPDTGETVVSSAPPRLPERSDEHSNWWRRRPVQYALLVITTVLLTVAAVKLSERFWPQKVVLGVQPFRNLGEPSEDFIAAGFTEEMIARLGQLHPHRLLVLRLTPGKPSSAHPTYVLQGTVRRFNDQVAVTAQLVEGNNQSVVWGSSYDRDVKDLLRVQAAVADAIASGVFKNLPHAPALAREVNQEAYLAYLEGRYFWNRRTPDSIQKGFNLFQKSISIDPTYAPAYAGLADCYELMGSAPYTIAPPKEAFPKAEEAARKALELDESLAEAHVSLGYAYLAYEWDLAGAEREFQRAIELRPSYPTGHQFYGYYLTAMGRLPEAIEERKKAVELDPLSPLLASALGEAYYQARQFDQTIEQNQRALTLDSSFAIGLVNIGRAYEMKGMYPQAQSAYQKILAVVPDDPAVLALLGHQYAVSGHRDEALRFLEKLKSFSKTRYVPGLYMALIYTGLGDKDQAFHWMEAAVAERTEYLVYLGSEPIADPLRGDPRFAALLKRVGVR